MTRAQTRLSLQKWSPSCNKCEAVRNVEVSYCSTCTCGLPMLMMPQTCLKQTCCTTFSADGTAVSLCCCSCRFQHRIAALGIRCRVFGSVLHYNQRHSTSQRMSQTGLLFRFQDSNFCCMTACTIGFHQQITLAVTMLFR